VSVVAQYWSGVLQRLQAEVEVFSRLVRHEGERGRANEVALASVLQAFFPRRLGVGTGLLIDTGDRYSKQSDLVVFEQVDEPTVLAQTTHLLHPVESVVVVVEVKTTLRQDDITDCAAKKEALLRLQPARQHPDGSTHPVFAVLAYDVGMSIDTLKRHWNGTASDFRPDLLCCVNSAIIGGALAPGAAAGDAYPLGFTFLHEQDADGDRLAAYLTASVGAEEMHEMRDGRTYMIVDLDGQRLLAEPARALLIFVESLVRGIAAKEGRPLPTVSHYMDSRVSEVRWV
jgi:hypothetical protein